jgi:hypothetical protein
MLGIFTDAFSQGVSIVTSTGSSSVCTTPVKITYFTISSYSGGVGGCSCSWAISGNGKIIGSNTNTSLEVEWDTTYSSGKVQVTLANCSNKKVNGTYIRDEFIQTLVGVSMAALPVPNIPCGSTDQVSVTLANEVNYANIPLTVKTYEWVLPSGYKNSS